MSEEKKIGPQSNSNHDSFRTAFYLILLCLVVVVLSAKGIRNEAVVSLDGDMPRYLMNGAFFHDFLRDLSFRDPLGYAYQYFARYPALSLGHHPLLLGVAEVPFYAVFGISVFSARITVVFFMLLAALAWFLLVRSAFDDTVAFLSSLLFVTAPFVVELSRVVMSEIPTVAMITVATFFFYQYCRSDKAFYAYAAAVSLALSVYGRHIAVFMFPVFLIYLLVRKGPKSLMKKEVLTSSAVLVLILLPLVLITLKFASAVLDVVSEKSVSSSLTWAGLSYFITVLWKYHLTHAVLVLALFGIVLALRRRDGRTLLFFLWMVSSFLLCTYMGLKGFQAPRYGMYWIPPFCLFAVLIVDLSGNRAWKAIVSAVLVVISGYQFALAYQGKQDFCEGFEEAAQYITENRKGTCVLYSGVHDTGYFIFFVRKHDPRREFIVLRANKILATSEMRSIVEERIDDPSEIYEILKGFGVAYVVTEDTKMESRSLEWLKKEVKSPNFILRKEIPLRSSSSRIDGVPLRIYEYKHYSTPKKGQVLDMHIPLMEGSIRVPLRNLMKEDQ